MTRWRRSLAEVLLSARLRSGLTQLDMCAEIGCAIRTVRRVETGEIAADRYVDRWLEVTGHRIGVQTWRPQDAVEAAAKSDADLGRRLTYPLPGARNVR